MREDFSQRTAHRIWHRVQGEGVPVLFIMGFGMRGQVWERQVASLMSDHECVYFDHAGLGNSGPISTRRLTMATMADDALGILDTLGWETAHVVGISMGGMIAQHLAVRAHARLRSLTLAATTPGGFPHVVPPLRGLRLFAKANGARGAEAVNALAELLFSPEFIRREPDLAMELLREDFSGQQPPRETRLAHLHAVTHHNIASRLEVLRRVPTMIIKPTQDVLVSPKQCDRLHRLIPHSVLHEIPAGHGVTRERPRRLTRVESHRGCRAVLDNRGETV
ncbi:MAG: alpha/beta hydrolase [bacterium]